MDGASTIERCRCDRGGAQANDGVVDHDEALASNGGVFNDEYVSKLISSFSSLSSPFFLCGLELEG